MYRHDGEVIVHTKWKKMLLRYIRDKHYDFECIRYKDVMAQDGYLYVNVATKQCDFIARFDLVDFTFVDVMEIEEHGKHFGLLFWGGSIFS